MKNKQANLFSPGESRRAFIKQSALIGAGVVIFPNITGCTQEPEQGTVLTPAEIKGLQVVDGESHLKNATWYEGKNKYDGFEYRFSPGTLADIKYLAADMLADGNTLIKFNIELREGEKGRIFQLAFGVLSQCSLRVRFPLSLVDQNTWRIPREGAFLKPMCWGDRVDLNKVDRMRFYIDRKSEQPARFCITPMIATKTDVPVIEHPVLPKGRLLDAVGQSTLHHWSGKTAGVDEMMDNLRKRLEEATHALPETFSSWGGCKRKKISDGTGYFGVHKYENRWWLVDPDGHLFWSAGIDSVRMDTAANIDLLEDALEFLPPEAGEYTEAFSEHSGQKHLNYLILNYIRTFGNEGWRENWATIALDELKRLRFNTVGNWSEWNFASRARVPYVRPMSFKTNLTTNIYRDFPDVFHADFEKDATDYAQTLKQSADDPAMIGYFMMNEPTWAFSKELPAVGILYNNEGSATRDELTRFLTEKYSTSEQLADRWKMAVDFKRIKTGKWQGEFSPEALVDLEKFSEIIVEKYFGDLSKACKKADPNHLNLGIRYQGVPPKWAVPGMKSFDVFSMNNYKEKVPFDVTEEIHSLLQMPVMIGEWHFGALDVGLPASGIGHVRTQTDRGKAYRVYFEDAAANPYCVGVHWFVLYDQSALGRFDGENYNIGFLDVCNRPHVPLCEAAIKSHEAMYDIADGKVAPYDDAPEYLEKVFL